MGIRDLLLGIGTTYDRTLGTGRRVHAQELLRSASNHLVGCVPSGLSVKASGGQGSSTFTPWIGIYDPQETLSSRRGLYLVYIFSADMRFVFLILNQGVTELKDEYGIDGALTRLERTAILLLERLPSELVQPWQDVVDLRTENGWRQRAYASGSVVAREYRLDDLPAESELRADLRDMADVFRLAIGLKKSGIDTNRGPLRDRRAAIQIGSRVSDARPLEGFRPKDSSDYIAHLKGRTLLKGRKHEKLIEDFVCHLGGSGFRSATVGASPRDLVAYRDEHEWLIEAKYVADGKVRDATRQALGQLFEYRFCLYEKYAWPHLVALFSEDVGTLFCQLLDENGIGVVWRTDSGWAGSERAVLWGLAGPSQ